MPCPSESLATVSLYQICSRPSSIRKWPFVAGHRRSLKVELGPFHPLRKTVVYRRLRGRRVGYDRLFSPYLGTTIERAGIRQAGRRAVHRAAERAGLTRGARGYSIPRRPDRCGTGSRRDGRALARGRSGVDLHPGRRQTDTRQSSGRASADIAGCGGTQPVVQTL